MGWITPTLPLQQPEVIYDSFSTSPGNQQMCDKLETGQVDRHEKCAFI